MTDEVNEIEKTEQEPVKFYKIEYEFTQPRTGFVYTPAPDADTASELIFEAVPEELAPSFKITSCEEATDEETEQLASIYFPTETLQ